MENSKNMMVINVNDLSKASYLSKFNGNYSALDPDHEYYFDFEILVNGKECLKILEYDTVLYGMDFDISVTDGLKKYSLDEIDLSQVDKDKIVAIITEEYYPTGLHAIYLNDKHSINCSNSFVSRFYVDGEDIYLGSPGDINSKFDTKFYEEENLSVYIVCMK